MTTHTNANHQRRNAARKGDRRGTIVILAVGILAVLAVASLSYMTVVRLDRSSSAAYATNANFRQQVGAAAGHIRSLIGADLFGNKIVTGSVRERINTINYLWPRAFEDGEYWDYPSVDHGWLVQPSDPERVPMPVFGVMGATDYSWRIDFDSILNRYPAARPDDAWLASQTPVDTDADGRWDTWPQITNLRSGWYYEPDPSGSNIPGWWQRDSGRFVDIAEWLTNSQGNAFSTTLGRGDPGIDINRFDTTNYGGMYDEDNESDLGSATTNMGGGPNLGIDRDFNSLTAPGIGTNLKVWEFQMSRMQEFLSGTTTNVNEDTASAASTVENIDDRMWADTDGDGRADARWQEIDALGELFGYRWLIAARIIDNSAMINVNSSLEWQFPGDSDNVGMGRTPGDVDLFRLLRRSNSNAIDPVTTLEIGHPDLIANPDLNPGLLADVWNHHRVEGWNLPAAFDEINDDFNTSYAGRWGDLTHDLSMGLNAGDPLEAREREMFWLAAGNSPQRRSALSANPVPLGDEIDLRAIFGSNYVPFTSKIEDRLDQIQTGGGSPEGWLPGMPVPGGSMEDYPSMQSLGPMRSKENGRELRTFGLNAQTPAFDFAANDYMQEDKIDRIMGDIRRHMTTINGSANFSPIPVLNVQPGSVYENRYVNTKIRLDDPSLIRDPVADASDLDGGGGIKARIAAFVNESFGAFLWALAPMVTDEPLAEGLDIADMNHADLDQGYGVLPASGPAFATDPAMKQIYSVLRAASLSINLADALDYDLASKESPTIGRFSPVGAIDNSSSREFVIEHEFSHGEIQTGTLTTMIPGSDAHLGMFNNGVTMVGLDRQPFLMEAATIAVLEDSRDPVNGNLIAEVDPSRIDDHVFSLMAFELGNPWGSDINVEDYVVRLSNGDVAKDFQFPLANTINGDTTITAGASKTFVVVFDQGMSSFPAHFNMVRDRFMTQLLADLDGDLSLVLGDDLVTIDPAGADAVYPAVGAVPFSVYAGDNAARSVQLYYKDPANSQLYLMDRMSPPALDSYFPWINEMAQFTAEGFSGTVQLLSSGRAVFSTHLQRPKGVSATGGFPSYVIEQPASNDASGWNVSSQQWVLNGPAPEDPVGPADAPELLTPFAIAPLDFNQGSDLLPMMPAMQLFVPNGPLRSVTELHMLNIFTHMFVNATPGYSSDPMTLNSGTANAHNAVLTGPGTWVTISEQLGDNANFFYEGTAGGTPNPYLGVLDPSRYVLGGDLDANPFTGTEWPDFMRIPLALRVFDCFTVTPGVEPLVQGKINLNTAPIEVLESMPFFAPESPVTPGIAGGTDLPASPMMSRAELVRDYRDLRETSPFDQATPDTRLTETGILGLRFNSAVGVQPDSKGLVNVGELLAMADWTSGDGTPGGDGSANTGVAGYDDFMQLGVDTASNDGAPLSLRYANAVLAGGDSSNDFPEFAFTSRNDYAASDFDPQDDPEERLALARSAIDMASTRSDVFTAYFILRAYNPEQIEIIQTQGVASVDFKAQMLDEQGAPNNSPGLNPIHESRWMGVFDRSNVTRPNQKPRVLLLVELPID